MRWLKKIFKILHWSLRSLATYFSNVYSHFLLWVYDVDYTKGIRFKGIPVIRKSKNSSIQIADNCRFNSAYDSNLIGVNRPCIIHTANEACLTIGSGSGFSGTVIGCFLKIDIGKNVKVGSNSLITDGDWHASDPRSNEPKEVIIKDNVWIGEGVKILKGVCIGENSLIGAGSVVTKSIPANVIAAGNPCSVIKPLILNNEN